MHSLPFAPASTPVKLQTLELTKPLERESSQEPVRDTSFADYLSSHTVENSKPQTDRPEERRHASNISRDETAKEASEETRKNEKSKTADNEGPVHGALRNEMLRRHIHTEEKTSLIQKKTGDQKIRNDSSVRDEKKKSKAEDFAHLDQSLAAIFSSLASLKLHKAEKPEISKDAKPAADKDSLLRHISTARRQTAQMEKNPLMQSEDKLPVKQADQFLAKLEQLLKKSSPRDIRQERFSALTDDLKKEITSIRIAADKHAKARPAEHTHMAFRAETQKTDTQIPAAAQNQEQASSLTAPASSNKGESDTQSGFSFMKQTHGAREASAAGRDQPHNLKGSAFAEHVDEIIEKGKLTVRDAKNGSLVFRLNPDNLGGVNVNLGLENGVLTAKFLVDSPEAKDALAANMNALKESFAQEGIQVGQFQVDVRTGGGQFSRDSGTGRESAAHRESENERISREYETVTMPSHNGMIDMVI